MSWLKRSNENLKAAQHCEQWQFWAPAVTRYYAAYHAALEVLAHMGLGAPEQLDGHDYWPHKAVAVGLAELIPGCAELEVDYRLLLSRRVPADYRQDPVTSGQCRNVGQIAERLIAVLREALKDED